MSPPQCKLLADSIPTGFGEGEEPTTNGEEESKTSPEAEEELPEFETLTENFFSIQLCDTEGGPHYLSQVSPDMLRSRLPVTVIINKSDCRLRGDCPRFNYLDLV